MPSFLTDTWSDTDIHWEGDSWNDSGNNMYGCLKQLNLLKKRNRNLKVLLSIGGWTYSSNFKGPASTPQGRETFARTSIDLLKNLGLDGIDIDWEYPQDSIEAANLVELLRTLRQALDGYASTVGNPHFELTVACPAAASNYNKMNIAGMDQYLDFWNLMAYDYAGSWDATAGHQANLFRKGSDPSGTPFNTAQAIEDYIAHGVAADKMVVGMPLYGRAFENTDGPGKPYNGVGQGNWEPGIYDFKNLPPAGAAEIEDAEAGASYSYDSGRRVFVSYDTVAMARRKAQWIKDRGLGGGMWWESSGDKQGGDSLITNVVDVFGGVGALKKQDNCISYPQSKYDNLRAGFPNN
jgi:chitinase